MKYASCRNKYPNNHKDQTDQATQNADNAVIVQNTVWTIIDYRFDALI